MRKQSFCICENKGVDCAADQRLCFRYIDSTISLLSKSKISSEDLQKETLQYLDMFKVVVICMATSHILKKKGEVL